MVPRARAGSLTTDSRQEVHTNLCLWQRTCQAILQLEFGRKLYLRYTIVLNRHSLTQRSAAKNADLNCNAGVNMCPSGREEATFRRWENAIDVTSTLFPLSPSSGINKSVLSMREQPSLSAITLHICGSVQRCQRQTMLQALGGDKALLTYAAVLVPCHCADVGTRRSPHAADVGNLGSLGD